MPSPANLAPVLRYLSALTRHNNRPWFEAHRAEYEAALAEFEGFVGRLIRSWSEVENLGGVAPKDCLYRIYRDIRFSANKTPYKTHFAAQIAPGGRKSVRLGYYMHVQPKGESLVAGGLYHPTSPQLVKFRQAIADDARPFTRIIGAKSFKSHFGALEGESVKTTPKGFSKDHPAIDLLRLKQVVVWEAFPDNVAGGSGFETAILAGFRALKPFLDYLNGVLA